MSLKTANKDVRSGAVQQGRHKRPFDLAVLFVGHLALLPLWVLIWIIVPLAIWLSDRGPVFYKQQRVGKHGRIFTLVKFRTMVQDAEMCGPMWTTEGDPRVTAVGKVLRRTALDELPGVFSILKGDMSLVGPRALDGDEQRWLEQEIPGFAKRLEVLPGLTGLAQVYDRTDSAQKKLDYDLEYVQRGNLWLDLKLIVLSIRNTMIAKWDHRSGKPKIHEPGPEFQNASRSRGDHRG